MRRLCIFFLVFFGVILVIDFFVFVVFLLLPLGVFCGGARQCCGGVGQG